MSKGKSCDQPAPQTQAAREPKLPPSLNSVRGWSNSEVQEEDYRRRLERMMLDLPLQLGAELKIADFARDLYEMVLLARYATETRRKTRSTARLKQLLREIESGANTLFRRLSNAPSNVFQAWASAADFADYINSHEVTYEWLQLKRLLENAAERAKQAAQAAVPKAEAPENRGRRSDYIAASITVVAAKAYEELTGRDAVRSIGRDTGKPRGEFHEFLTVVFKALGIDSSPDAANMQLQADRQHLRNPREGQ
jgi:hypothetical protein